jgi:ATP-dependent DNA ligase
MPKSSKKTDVPSASRLLPMEARLVDALPEEGAWQFEPKWDGFRCLVLRDGAMLELRAKSGKPLARYFPEIAAAFAAFKAPRFVLDGELVIPIGADLSFEALQMRLHPAASRVQRLARETPALFMAFDLLVDGRRNLMQRPLRERRAALEAFYRRERQPLIMRVSPYARDVSTARRWLARAGGALDGVVAKRLDAAYVPGERLMLKVKCLRTADCVVGGFRYAEGSREVGSMLLGLYNDEGKLDHVGFTAAISQRVRPALTKRLEQLRGGPGFTGAAPGGPSRWSSERTGQWEPLKTKLVAEVRYDQVTGRRFRHGTRFLRWRPDKAPRQCTFTQLQQEARPAEVLAAIVGRAARN